MEVAWTLAQLIPSPLYDGTFSKNTREEYEALRWLDSRAKPAWEQLEAAWPQIEQILLESESERKANERLLADRLIVRAFEIIVAEIEYLRPVGKPRQPAFQELIDKLKAYRA